MTVNLTSTRQGVRLRSGRTGVAVVSSRPRVTLVADRQGRPGIGVPAGGAADQVLAKASSADWDTEWVDQSVGGALSLGELSDVDTTSDPPDVDDVLAWDGTDWTPATLEGLGAVDGAVAKVDWLVRRFGTGTPALDPIGDFAAWEAAAVAYWNLSDGDDFAFYDTLSTTQSGIYTYTAGVGVARKAGFTTTADLHRTAAVGKLYRSHLDDTVFSSPAYTTGFVVFLADDPTDAIGTAEWHVNWLVDDRTFGIVTEHINDTSDAHDASAVSYAGGTNMAATDVEAAIDELANEKQHAGVSVFFSNGTIPSGGFFGVLGGSAFTMPAVSTNAGQSVTVLNLTGSTITLNCAGSDIFVLSSSASFSLIPQSPTSFVAVPGVGWVLSLVSGIQFDLPFFSGSTTANYAVKFNGTVPVWASGGGLHYTAATSGDWDGTAPTTLGAAIDRCAALLKTLNGGTGP